MCSVIQLTISTRYYNTFYITKFNNATHFTLIKIVLETCNWLTVSCLMIYSKNK